MAHRRARAHPVQRVAQAWAAKVVGQAMAEVELAATRPAEVLEMAALAGQEDLREPAEQVEMAQWCRCPDLE